MSESSLRLSQQPFVRDSTRLRIVAIGLVIVPALGLGYLGRSFVYPLAICAAAIYGGMKAQRREMDGDSFFRLLIAIAVVFLIRYMVAPPNFPISRRMLNSPLFHVLAQAMLALQIVSLSIRRVKKTTSNEKTANRDNDRARFHSILPALGAVALVCAADLKISIVERWTFQSLVLIFTVLYAMFATMMRPFVPARTDAARDSRAFVLGICVVVTALVSWVSAALLFRHEQDLDQLISRFVEPAPMQRRTGFSADGRLGSISNRQDSRDDNVSLRIYSSSEPGYFRGAVFESYGQSRWLFDPGALQTVFPRRASSVKTLATANDEDGQVYSLPWTDRLGTQSMERLECWPGGTHISDVFLPLNAEWLQLEAEDLRISPSGQVDPDHVTPGLPWNIFRPEDTEASVSQSPERFTEKHRKSLLAPVGTEEIDALANVVFMDCETTSEKIRAVESFFHNEFEYGKGISVPGGVNAVDWFLRTKPAAHCEFFATGAVALLRRAGIPARYVTGFVVSEQNTYGGYWVARNRHAHAWAEAWDDASAQWITVEATPASGIPVDNVVSKPRQIFEYLQARFLTLRVRLQTGGMSWLGGLLVSFLLHPILLLLVGGAILFLLARHFLRYRKPRSNQHSRSPQMRRMNRLLSRMDKRVKRSGFFRDPAETLTQFAHRLDSTESGNYTLHEFAEWYRSYAELRYARVADTQQIKQLSERMNGRKRRA